MDFSDILDNIEVILDFLALIVCLAFVFSYYKWQQILLGFIFIGAVGYVCWQLEKWMQQSELFMLIFILLLGVFLIVSVFLYYKKSYNESSNKKQWLDTFKKDAGKELKLLAKCFLGVGIFFVIIVVLIIASMS